jgi:group I intron endonuclease
MVIYKTTNLINGKQYIGRDSHNNPNYLGSGTLLKNAIKRYGKENFKKEIIEECTSFQHLIKREEYWLNYYNAGNNPLFYNLHNDSYGVQQTPDIRKKISESVTGERNHFFGKHHTDIAKQRIGNSRKGDKHYLYGKKMPEETKLKLAQSIGVGENAHGFKGYIVCVGGDYIGQRKTNKEWCTILGIMRQNFRKHLRGEKYKNGIKGNFFKWDYEIK